MQSRLYLLLSVLLSASTLIAANSGVRSPDVLPVHRRADEKSDNKAGDQLSAEQRAEQGLAPGIDGDLKQDHAHHGPKHRECKISEKPEEVEFRCKAKTENEADDIEIKDEIKFKIKSKGEGLQVKVEYKHKVEDNTDDEADTESKTQYEVFFDSIIEYSKPEGSNATDQAYDWENDQVLQTVDLLEWGKFTDIVDDGTVAFFSVTSSDGTASFNFTITRSDSDPQEVGTDAILATGGNESSTDVVNEGDTFLTANKMKIDFMLTNFKWMKESASNVALISKVQSKRKIKIDPKDQSEDGDESSRKGPPHTREVKDVKIDFEDAEDTLGELTPFGEYSWVDSAVATDGNGTVTIAVVATSPAASDTRRMMRSEGDEMMDRIAFSFVGEGAHSDYIYWDPETGIGYAESGGSVICVTTGVVATLITMFFV